MPPVAFPNPIPSWVKGAFDYFTTPKPSYYEELLQYLENLTTDEEWRRLELRFQNTASGAVIQDDMYCTFDIQNITAGQADSTWVTTDYTKCEARFNTFMTTYAAFMQNWSRLIEYRWYTRKFNPPTDLHPFAPTGPPQRVQTVSVNGSASALQAPQVAISVTERTAWAKHWGRFYLPAPSGTVMVAGGRFSGANMTTLASAVQTLYEGLAADDFQVVVPVTSVDKVRAGELLTVSSIQIDDVPDVIRRRRPHNTISRAIKP